jgi:hypothetical protein
MDAPPINNETEFVADPHTLAGKDGERLAIIVKGTFVLTGLKSGKLELADAEFQRKLRGADVPWGDPSKSSIKYPSDLFLTKPGTDVIVVAAACAPGGKPVPSFDCGVRVGSLEKTVRIFGLRVWEANGSGVSAPRPTTGIEVRYDYAWGGIDATDMEKVVEEPRNTVGMGITRDSSLLTHKPAPFIEDPLNPIASVRTRPPPAGLGAIGRSWEPRRFLHGTYDAAWREQRAPLLPLDHDDRSNLCASPGLTASPPLLGGEDVALLNLTPGGGSVSFKLPKLRVTVAMTVKDKPPETLSPYLDTVILDTVSPKVGDVVVELVWRAIFRPPRKLKHAEITVTEKELS